MSKDSWKDYSTTASSNTDLGGISSQGTSAASNIDNLFREMMAQIADVVTGAEFVYDTMTWCDPADETKAFRFDGVGITTGNTRVLTIPDATGTVVLADATQTLTNKTYDAPSFTGAIGLPANSVSFAALDQVGAMRLLGNATGSAANVAEVTILDEDDMDTDSASAIPTQQSVKAYVDASGIGVGQTWQDVSGSRAVGTAYQNTTGKPIMVMLSLDVSSGRYASQVSATGAFAGEEITFSKVPSSGTATFTLTGQSFVVPSGTYYRVVEEDATVTIRYWTELR